VSVEPLSVEPVSPQPAVDINASRPKPSLVGLTRAQLFEAMVKAGIPERERKMRAQQLWQWTYERGARDFGQIINVSKAVKSALAEHWTLDRPEIVTEQISTDGTRKWLIRMAPTSATANVSGKNLGAEIETVYIPEADRGTLCVSSQVGCTLTCTFCHTGTQRLVRNLTAAEIVAQLMVARDRLNDFPVQASKGERPDENAPPRDPLLPVEGSRLVSNIVFMGMGEPLYNREAVRDAIDIMADGEGLALGRRRITVSTSGVVPEIGTLGEETGAMLAISLHAVRDELRNELVPLNKKYPIAVLLEACRNYPGVSNARRITFEYVMLKGVNDSDAEARELVRLLKGIPAKINLIPFNPWPGTRYECSDWERIERFSDIVFNAGYASPVRTPRGRDILAACGQLKSETEKLSARARLMAQENEAGLMAQETDARLMAEAGAAPVAPPATTPAATPATTPAA
jgi:23S rRNA (adenine2503-C2)-methyltransferase